MLFPWLAWFRSPLSPPVKHFCNCLWDYLVRPIPCQGQQYVTSADPSTLALKLPQDQSGSDHPAAISWWGSNWSEIKPTNTWNNVSIDQTPMRLWDRYRLKSLSKNSISDPDANLLSCDVVNKTHNILKFEQYIEYVTQVKNVHFNDVICSILFMVEQYKEFLEYHYKTGCADTII